MSRIPGYLRPVAIPCAPNPCGWSLPKPPSLHRRSAALLAAAIFVLAAPRPFWPQWAVAQDASGEVDVRVAAQRLADGRTEFALQEREADGSWGARRLPTRRMFPAGADVGRWLSSSPLTVEVQSDGILADAQTPGIEVRVAAQRLADDRMEFALQEREADGSWGARRLPTRRMFPAGADVGRWLSSSALTVVVAEPVLTPVSPESCVLVDNLDAVMSATVQVQTTTGAGTAFYIGADEWLTAAHVVEGGGSIRLRTDTLDLPATVIGRDDAADLALLRASGEGLTALAFGDHDALRVGQTLGVAGYPVTVSGSPSVTSGLLSRFTTDDEIDYIQTSAEISPGNSGGPLFTDCGAVVGVLVLKAVHEAIEGIALAVALPTIMERLPQLRAGAPPVAEEPAAALVVTAICNDGDWSSSADCQAAAAAGLNEDARIEVWVRGVEDWANVAYRFDGGASFGARDRDARWAAFAALAPGAHTIETRERRGGEWTPWSAPYVFTIRGAAESDGALTITALCNGEWDTGGECAAAGRAGIDPGEGWGIWVAGVEEWANVRYRLDGGAAVTWENLSLRGLAPGPHTIGAREQRGGRWTAWSEPYVFTIRGTGGPVTPTPPVSTAETVAVLSVGGGLGVNTALIQRPDGSFWLIDYGGGCSASALRNGTVMISGLGTARAAMAIDRGYSQEQCGIVRADDRVERVHVTFPFSAQDPVLMLRGTEQWALGLGACIFGLMHLSGPAYVHSPGLFAGIGAQLILAQYLPQSCLILSATRR